MTQGAFDSIELPDDFDPMGIFMEGKKDKNGSVLVSSTDIIEGKASANIAEDDDELSDEQKSDNEKEVKLNKLLNFDDDTEDENKEEDKNEEEDEPENKIVKAKVDKTDKSDGDNPLMVYYKMMVDDGLWEEDEEFDGSENKFLEVKEKNNERLRDEDINDYLDKAFAKNPDGKQYGKSIIAHLASGGKLKDFIDINQGADISETDLDSEDEGVAESAAEVLAGSYLQLIGWEPTEIKDFIKSKKDKNQLIDYAKEHFKPYQKQVAKANENQIVKSKNDELNRKKQSIQYTTQINEIINSVEKVGNFELPKSPKERKELLGYMLSPIEQEDGRQIPKYTADYIKLHKDPEFNIVLATVLKAWKSNTAKKVTTNKSTTDQVKILLGRTEDSNNNGNRRQPAPEQDKKTTKLNWSF